MLVFQRSHIVAFRYNTSFYQPQNNESFAFCRLLDVVHSEKKLYLVFEYLDLDLKKHMETAPPSGLSPQLVKVLNKHFINRVLKRWGRVAAPREKIQDPKTRI